MTPNILDSPDFGSLLTELRTLPTPERADDWPETHFSLLSAVGGWKWNMPADCGGYDLTASAMLQIYRRMSAASLLTTFIFTQRNAACQRIESSLNLELRTRLLTQMVTGQLFGTVGISHLTTSRQFLQTPAVSVTRTMSNDGYLLNGHVPWATGATRAQVLVTGGTLSDRRQILAAVPTDRDGVRVLPPVALMGLSASQTGAVELQNVFVADGEVLHGPIEKVMSQASGGGAGSLGTSALAIGAAEGTLQQLDEEIVLRPELREFIVPMQQEATSLAEMLLAASLGQVDDATATSEELRRRANLLVIRAAQMWLAATRGAGYVAGHPAERAVRESMFFMVWSCPQPVLNANLRELSCLHSSSSGMDA